MKLLKCFTFNRSPRFAYQQGPEAGKPQQEVSKADKQTAQEIAGRTDENFLPKVEDLKERRQDIVDAAVLALKDKQFQKKNPIAYEKIRSLYTDIMQGHRIDARRQKGNQSYIDSNGWPDWNGNGGIDRGNGLTEVEKRNVNKAASDLYLALLNNGKFPDVSGDVRQLQKDAPPKPEAPKPPESVDKRTPEQKFGDAFAKITLEFGNHEQTQLYLDMRKHILDVEGQDNANVHAQVVYDYISARLRQLTQEEKALLFEMPKDPYERRRPIDPMHFDFNGISTSIVFTRGERGQLNLSVSSHKPDGLISPIMGRAQNVTIFHSAADFSRVDKPKAPDKAPDEPMFIDAEKDVLPKVLPGEQRYNAILDQIDSSGKSDPKTHAKVFYDYINDAFTHLSPREKQVLAGQSWSYSVNGVNTQVEFVGKGESSVVKVTSILPGINRAIPQLPDKKVTIGG
ncbi:MAG: hypothetical protein WC843_02230 [Candidatus Gracilibacteria bacterium]|jgi:hypothetical protein